MLETDNRGVNQLLLSPLFLLDRILGTLAPGVLLVILLSLKGNRLLRIIWFDSTLGYKTKLAVLIFVAYIAGTLLKIPYYVISKFAKKPKLDMPPGFESQHPEVTKAFYTIATDGVLWSSPKLLDKLSLSKSEVVFHIGAGIALVVASAIPGDGLRTYELIFGLFLFAVGIRKAHDYVEEVGRTVAIGIATVIGNMTSQQIIMLKAVFESLKTPMNNPVIEPADSTDTAAVLPPA